MNGGFSDYYGVSVIGKVFLAGIAASILGKLSNIKIRGTQDEIDALKHALLASRRFQEELNRPGATVESIMTKLHLKNASAEEFSRILGISWPL